MAGAPFTSRAVERCVPPPASSEVRNHLLVPSQPPVKSVSTYSSLISPSSKQHGPRPRPFLAPLPSSLLDSGIGRRGGWAGAVGCRAGRRAHFLHIGRAITRIAYRAGEHTFCMRGWRAHVLHAGQTGTRFACGAGGHTFYTRGRRAHAFCTRSNCQPGNVSSLPFGDSQAAAAGNPQTPLPPLFPAGVQLWRSTQAIVKPPYSPSSRLVCSCGGQRRQLSNPHTPPLPGWCAAVAVDTGTRAHAPSRAARPPAASPARPQTPPPRPPTLLLRLHPSRRAHRGGWPATARSVAPASACLRPGPPARAIASLAAATATRGPRGCAAAGTARCRATARIHTRGCTRAAPACGRRRTFGTQGGARGEA
eukprot:360947-Chlamydomonas_euryale.AAC.2